MLYPENKKPALDESTFRNPPSEYRAAPFWAWNCLEKRCFSSLSCPSGHS